MWPAAIGRSVTRVECKRLPILLNAFDAYGNGDRVSGNDRWDAACHRDDDGAADVGDEGADVNAVVVSMNANVCGVLVRRPNDRSTR